MLPSPGAVGNRLRSIDILRGVAVLAVVLHHLPFSWAGFGSSDASAAFAPGVIRVTHYGEYGVHLFLVISGFCIHLGWARAADTSRAPKFSAFWARRLRRLYPPYVAALAGTVALLAVGKILLARRFDDPLAALGYSSGTSFALDIIASLLLLQNITGAAWRLGNGPFWTLALEEQLYALYFPLLFLRRKYGWVAAFGVALGVTIAWRSIGILGWSNSDRPEFWFFVGPARWAEWALGAIAVEAHLGLLTLPRWATRLSTAVAFAILAIGFDEVGAVFLRYRLVTILVGDFSFGLAFFFAINWLTRLETAGRLPIGRAAVWLGAAGVFSYSVYLVHQPLMGAIKQLVASTGSLWLVVLVRMVGGIGGGYLFHVVVERRFLSPRSAAPVLAKSPTPAGP